MINIDKKLILQKLLELAEICNEILLRNFLNLNEKNICYKNNSKDIFTSIDTEIEKLTKEFLLKNFPFCSLICEESFDENENFEDKKLVFAIDPIDGTSNFVNGLEFFAYSIGVFIDNKIVGGIVSAPLLNKIFYGIEDVGSFMKNLRDNSIESLFCNNSKNVKLKNERKHLIGCSALFGLKLKKPVSFRILGSIALSVVYCANQTFDGFYCPNCKVWDFAGGLGVLRAMNFPIHYECINLEKQIYQVAVHNDQNELNEMICLFDVK